MHSFYTHKAVQFCANLFIIGCAGVHSIESVCHSIMVEDVS